MKIAIFSDVHGNLIALERFVDASRSEADAYLCLGDIVNYGPWSDECLEIVQQLPGIAVLEGNHERLFLGKDDPAHESPLVQEFFRCAKKDFSRFDLIGDLPREKQLGRFRCLHTIGGRSIYPDTTIAIDQDYIIGHTHHQFKIERSGFSIVNPGSIGQNRRWIDRVEFAIFDTETEDISFQSIPYDIERFLTELGQRGYPDECIDYYARKPRRGR